MSRQYRGFLISLFIHTLFIYLIYVFFDTSSSTNEPLLIDLTLLGPMNEAPGPKGTADRSHGLQKEADVWQDPAEKIKTAVPIPKPRKPIPKPKTVQKTQDPKKALEAPEPQLLPATEPEGPVPTPSPHIEASGLSAAPPLQAAFSGEDIPADSGLGGGGATGQGAGTGSGEGAGSKNTFLNKHMEAHFAYVKDLIQKNIIYPKRARLMGWQGKVVVSFVILENGCAKKIRIKESSGNRLLDDNVIKTVKALSPFPRPPVKSELLVPIVYRLEGT